ncbi:MAG: nuclear transport factor 2 family protein, partial [Candidatus Binatia bacterium]
MATVSEDKDAIRELIARYCFLIDGKQYDEWAKTFAEDAVFEVVGTFKFEGREAIRAFADNIPLNEQGLPGFKHCTLNHVVSVDGDRAKAECYVVLVNDGKPLQINMAGRYEDDLVKQGGRWLFRKRT